MIAPRAEQEISSEGVCELYQPIFLSVLFFAHQHRLFALLPMLSHRHWLKSLAEESSTVSNRNIHSIPSWQILSVYNSLSMAAFASRNVIASGIGISR